MLTILGGNEMKKKMGILALSAVLGVSLVACTGTGTNPPAESGSPDGSNAYALYTAAAEKAEAATAMEMNQTVVISFAYGEESETATTETAVKTITHSDTDVELQIFVTSSEDGDYTTYYRDGVLYYEDSEQKGKQEVGMEEIIASLRTGDFDVAENAIKDETVNAVAGGTELSFTLDADAMNDQIEEMFADLLSIYEGMDMSFSDILFHVQLDEEGNLKNTNLVIPITIVSGGESITMNVESTIVYVAYGEDVVIEAPADLDTY